MWLQWAIGDERSDSEHQDYLACVVSFLKDQALLWKAASAGQAVAASYHARLAAAYHLWPYYARAYYGPQTGLEQKGARLEARQQLCAIQQLLFANVRGTLDFLRLSFNATRDAGLKPYLSSVPGAGGLRLTWRDERLLPPAVYPDLCAIDSLAEDMVKMEEAMPLLNHATFAVHRVAMGIKGSNDRRDREETSEGLRRLGIAHLVVFHDADWAFKKPSPRMLELVHSAPEKLQSSLKQLIPFHTVRFKARADGTPDEPDQDADSFRRLANAIFSCDAKSHRAFAEQRNATLKTFKVLRVRSSGHHTEQFLRVSPKFHRAGQPVWFGKTLKNLARVSSSDIPDWSHEKFWWNSAVSGRALIEHLLVERLSDEMLSRTVHHNHHASALWDYLASKGRAEEAAEPIFVDNWGELLEWVKGCADLKNQSANAEPRKRTVASNPLLEILLRRRETLTRTSFLFGINQTPDDESGRRRQRLYQFVSGTFLGLERPGVPYEVARFQKIADLFRGTILGLADCCMMMVERQRQRGLEDRESRRVEILKLLQGRPYLDANRPGAGEGPPFAHPDYPHTPDEKEVQQLPLVIGLQRILKNVEGEHAFTTACVGTLKALFYLFQGTCAKSARELRWPRPEDCPAYSSRPLGCLGCINAILRALVVPPPGQELPDVEADRRAEGISVSLPSFPGLRFVVALAELLHVAAQEYPKSAQPAWVKSMVIKPGELLIEWSGDFPAILFNALLDERATQGRVVGALKQLKKCAIEVPPARELDERIADVLRSESCHGAINLMAERTRLVLCWGAKSHAES